ncbi:MAG: PAS domain S-box protein [Planctomycetota bacterium]|nr:PAS domain S-box protein [Planctomycetota bacterium]
MSQSQPVRRQPEPGDLFLTVDSQGRVTRVSHGDCPFLGLPARTLLGKSIETRLGPALSGGDLLRWRQAFERRTPDSFEVSGSGPDGGWSLALHPADEGAVLQVRSRDRDSVARARVNPVLLNAMPGRVAVLDCHGTIVQVNEAWDRFAAENRGTPLAQCTVGANYLNLRRICADAQEPDVRVALAGIESVLEGAVTGFTQEYASPAEGRQRWFHKTVTRLSDGSGAVVSHVDVTRRRLAEAALRQSEERYRGLAEATNEGVWVTDPAGVTLHANAPMAAMLGSTPGAMIGRPATDFAFPEDLHASERRAEGGARRRFRREDGGECRAHCISTLIRDAEGRIDCVLELFTAMSAEDVAREDLNLASRRLGVVLDAMTDTFFSLDREWRVTHLNTHAERVFGKPREQVLGRNFWELFPQALGTEFERHYRRAMSEGVVERFEAEGAIRPGRWFEVHVYPSGEGLSVFTTDVTDHRLARGQVRHLAGLVERAADLVAVIETDHSVSYLNPAGRALIGLAHGDTGRVFQIEDLFLPEDLPEVQSKMLPEVAKSGRWAGPFRLRHQKTGEPLAVTWDLFRIDDPRSGKPVSLAAIGRDIRRQQAAERALDLARVATEHDLARFEAVVAAMNDGLVIADTQGRIYCQNPTFLALHGFASEADFTMLAGSLTKVWELRDLDGNVVPFADWPL